MCLLCQLMCGCVANDWNAASYWILLILLILWRRVARFYVLMKCAHMCVAVYFVMLCGAYLEECFEPADRSA